MVFVCMDAIRRERLSLGELLPVGRLRGVVLMHIFDFVEPLSVIAARCHLSPRRGLIVLQSNILKTAFS